MQKIVPQLWFDTQAKEAVAFYLTVFPDSRLLSTNVLMHDPEVLAANDLQDAPPGIDVLAFILGGLEFGAISAGPMFKANPSVSFMVNFDPSKDPKAKEHLDETWAKLSQGGKVLMPLQAYPFSEHYGWVEDRFGISWQLILTKPEGEPRPFIIPSLLFTQGADGRAEEALKLYASLFPHSKLGTVARYPAATDMHKKDSLMFGEVNLSGEWLVAMDGGNPHGFAFNEGLSLLVRCADQAEVDHYWDGFTKDGGQESQCGWLKDKFGLSWQIVPKAFDDLMGSGDKAAIGRAMAAMMPMKKLDVAALENAARG